MIAGDDTIRRMNRPARRKTVLTDAQRVAWNKLREGIEAIADLPAEDADALQSWLGEGFFGGPSRASERDELVFGIAIRTVADMQAFEFERGSVWEEMIQRSVMPRISP
jgi:hypothetical protein